jgi:transcriptional regulator with XRE-family HTH domain
MKNMGQHPTLTGTVNVGRRLRELRIEHDFSIRELAERSNLNVNTIGLIEKGKSSPSVSTLQQIALALDIPITAFFETGLPKTNIVFQKAGQRLKGNFTHGTLENLGTGLAHQNVEPFMVTLEPEAGSGDVPMVHTGLEFVFCLEGHVIYTIEGQAFLLEPGDSLLFEARLPHSWGNGDLTPSRFLLVLCPSDENDQPSEVHFIINK